MIMLETKKALNFDISDSLLKQYYPSKSYKNGWKDINKYLVRYGFLHRQYSGYVSKDDILMTDVFNLVGKLSRQYPWLKMSVMIFDVTIVGNEYNLLPIIKDES